MKVIKNIIFVAIVFLISIVLLVVGNGYDMYKDAISKIPLTEKVETIKEKENYTKINPRISSATISHAGSNIISWQCS
jgi:hypothetical protein